MCRFNVLQSDVSVVSVMSNRLSKAQNGHSRAITLHFDLDVSYSRFISLIYMTQKMEQHPDMRFLCSAPSMKPLDIVTRVVTKWLYFPS